MPLQRETVAYAVLELVDEVQSPSLLLALVVACRAVITRPAPATPPSRRASTPHRDVRARARRMTSAPGARDYPAGDRAPRPTSLASDCGRAPSPPRPPGGTSRR